ncbi:MAG TPA: hypothetical protein VMD31_17130 [Opitutaceae bacterium]|nr:hypothetical protein [Opitutaceae bacterium]
MNDFDSRWARLVAAARGAPAPADVAAPYGFAVRVAARAWADDRPTLQGLFGRFALRALWVACLLMLASVAVDYFYLRTGSQDEYATESLYDPVSEVLNSSS